MYCVIYCIWGQLLFLAPPLLSIQITSSQLSMLSERLQLISSVVLFFYPHLSSSSWIPLFLLAFLLRMSSLGAVKPPSEGGGVNKQRGELDVQPQYTVQPSGPVPISLTGCLRHTSANMQQMCFSHTHTATTKVNPRNRHRKFMHSDSHKVNTNASSWPRNVI